MHLDSADTPLMQQYVQIKKEHKDALLLFQVGDFYELFFDDAKQAAACLAIALTARGKNKGEPIPLCGVPVHAVDHYLTRLIKAGFKVALCNQLEEAVPGKVVRRGVTQVLTPGTLTDTRLLDEKSASYLFSFFPMKESWGLLFAELLTAQLFATVLEAAQERQLETELSRFFPDEIILPATKQAAPFQALFKKHGYFTSMVPVEEQSFIHINEVIQSFLGQKAVADFSQHEPLGNALYYFHAYLTKNQLAAVQQPWQVQYYKPEDFVQLDAATQRNLELTVDASGGKAHTLFNTLDRAATPMGSRLIKKWLVRPLLNKGAIEQRQEVVAHFVRSTGYQQELTDLLGQIGDLERIVGRIALRRASIYDYILLSRALLIFPALITVCTHGMATVILKSVVSCLQGFEQLAALLSAACNTDTSFDGIIAQRFDPELDRLRDCINGITTRLLAFEKSEQERTGITSLKVGYNQLHGYYLEVTKAQSGGVPGDYIRYQSLVGKERYVTPALQKMQYEVTQARLAIREYEAALFEKLKSDVAGYTNRLRKAAYALATLDALGSFGQVASQAHYVRPAFNDTGHLSIKKGRHPVVERTLVGHFIPNDTHLDDQSRVCIITGPNMGGKSTYLRQVALTSLLAQCGAFVPADSADLPLVDRIFTRIGAGDNLAYGKSTFLVEMEETATICTQATKKSLIILDEVGRGTSTFDGLAIAQAVVEYIYHQVGAYCLFATHYHELTRLHDQCPGIANYYAASKKTANGILLLYKIVAGVADGSFGIDVARAAHLPLPIITRAQELLGELTKVPQAYLPAVPASTIPEPMNDQVVRLVHQLASVDCDHLSPRQAWELLWQLHREVKEGSLSFDGPER